MFKRRPPFRRLSAPALRLAAGPLFAAALIFAGCVPEESRVPAMAILGAAPGGDAALKGGTGGENAARTKPPPPGYITIIAAGDNLIHDIIYNNARIPQASAAPAPGEGGPPAPVSIDGFNFDSCYEHIKPIIKKADIAFVNQETVLGGGRFGYSGYPMFNTPQDAGLGLINAGFNVVNHASNHAMDKGEGAVFGTMDFWDARGEALCLGVFRSEEQRKTSRRIVEKNGIRVGFLSYTYGLNGFTLPKDKPWLVGIIDREVMGREIDALRPYCDLLAVSMHWGNEFRHDPNPDQKELAAFLAEHGVDLVIGHHPHVTQPVEIFPRPDGKKMVCYYSLGDLLSHTQSDWTPDTMTGALAYIRVRKSPGAGPAPPQTTIETAAVIPTVCHYGRERKKPFTVYPLWDYTDALAALHYKPRITVEYLEGAARQVYGIRVMSRADYDRLEQDAAPR
jgi:poly-gamma-glutamate synthesis protein (capsule biosynthesis protein)